MNIQTVIKKKIVVNENGYISPSYKRNNSISFFADIPKSAVVDHIKVDGVFLEDVEAEKVIYHKELVEGDSRVVATVHFFDDALELYEKLAEYVVQDFEVYYHLEAVVDAD